MPDWTPAFSSAYDRWRTAPPDDAGCPDCPNDADGEGYSACAPCEGEGAVLCEADHQCHDVHPCGVCGGEGRDRCENRGHGDPDFDRLRDL
jgi:hypothetical protein